MRSHDSCAICRHEETDRTEDALLREHRRTDGHADAQMAPPGPETRPGQITEDMIVPEGMQRQCHGHIQYEIQRKGQR